MAKTILIEVSTSPRFGEMHINLDLETVDKITVKTGRQGQVWLKDGTTHLMQESEARRLIEAVKQFNESNQK